MSESNSYDAAVVGGGPIGSYLACRLADLGYKVVVLERSPEVGHAVCCTGIIGKECFERFDLPREAIAFSGSSCTVHSPAGKTIRLVKDSVQAYVVDRPTLDKVLASRASGAGAEYRLSTKVTGISVHSDGIRADVQSQGEAGVINARMAIIGNGFGFALTRKSGLGQVGDYVLGAQAEVPANGTSEVEVYFGKDVAPGFFAWLVPRSEGRALVGVLARRTPGVYMKKLLVKLADQGKIGQDEATITYGGIPLRPLPRTYADRLIAVGDAAGHVKPTTGGGIYYGLLGADIAAESIDRAMREGDLSARRLRRYEKRWRDLLGRELDIGYWGRRLYERLGDNRIDQMFDIIARNGVHDAMLQSSDFSFDWHGTSILRAMRYKELRLAVWSAAKSLLPF